MLARPSAWYFSLAGNNEAGGDREGELAWSSELLKECGGHWSLLGLDDINKLLPEGQASLVPAAAAINMLHADIMLGLVPIELPFQQPVCPEALVGGRDGTRHCIAGDDL